MKLSWWTREARLISPFSVQVTLITVITITPYSYPSVVRSHAICFQVADLNIFKHLFILQILLIY